MSHQPSHPTVSCAVCAADFDGPAKFCPRCGVPVELREKRQDSFINQEIDGRYRINERLGFDWVGRIYRAETIPDGSPVAIVLVHEHLSRHRSFSGLFDQRVAAARELSHPGIVGTLEGGRAEVAGEAVSFVVRDAFEGRKLSTIIQDRGLLPPTQVIQIGLEVLEALGDAHRQGGAHLALSPGHVVLGATAEGEVRAKVDGFGLGRLAGELAGSMCLAGSSLGTGLFAAPEVIAGDDAGPISDLYSLAAILFEQLTGHRPIEASSNFTVPPAPRDLPADALRSSAPNRRIGQHVEEVILQALAPKPSDRFPSAEAMADALRTARDADAADPAPEPPADVVSTPPSLLARQRVVGRSELVDLVLSVAHAPLEPGPAQGAVAVVLGGAGMGKSAIVSDVVNRLTGGPIAILQIDGRRALCRPLEPFTELIRDLLGVGRGAESSVVSDAQNRLTSRLGMDDAENVRLIDRLTARVGSLAVTPDIVEREEVSTLLSFLGRMVASCPTLLIVEDADALDASSLQLVLDLMEAASTRALSVVVTARGEPWPEWDAPHVTRVTVPPLDDRRSLLMLRARLLGAKADPDLFELAATWCKGSPLLLDLWARGVLRSDPLVAQGAPPRSSSEELFGGLRQLVAMTLRGTPPLARRWLSCAALGGHRVPITLLEAFEAPDSRDEVVRACLGSGLIQCAHGHLQYRNEGVRHLVRTQVPEADRTQIHTFLASWLGDGEPSPATAEVVAAHHAASGSWSLAGTLLEDDADDLMRRDEPAAAAALLNRAVRAWRQADDKKAMVRAGLAQVEALLQSGDGKGASDVLAHLERFGMVTAEGLRARVFAVVAAGQGDTEMALKALTRASDIAMDSLDQLGWYRVENRLAEFLFELARFKDAEVHAVLAYELARAIVDASRKKRPQLVDSARVSQAAAFLAKLKLVLGEPDEAEAALSRALDYANQVGDDASAARLLAHLAHSASEQSKVAEALKLSEQALEYAQRVGDRMASARTAINVGTYQKRRGHTQEASESFSLARSLALAVGWSKGVRLARDAKAHLG